MLSILLPRQAVALCTSASPCRLGRGALSTILSAKYSKVTGNYDPDDIDDDDLFLENNSGYSRPVVQWYPGHIAKAERELSKTLKMVDVVVEVRDARAVKATSHPLVATWCAGRPRIVALTHGDQVPSRARLDWK